MGEMGERGERGERGEWGAYQPLLAKPPVDNPSTGGPKDKPLYHCPGPVVVGNPNMGGRK